MAEQNILHRIGSVSRQLGLTVHTIRAWEKRYNAVVPVRTPRGGRLYTEQDVLKLAAIRDLVRLGHGVGTIAALPLKTLRARIADAEGQLVSLPSENLALLRERFLEALADDDWWSLEQMLNQWATLVPTRGLIVQVLAPLVVEVGERWHRHELTISQEHLATGLIRTVLGNLLRLQTPRVGAPVAVAATLSGERHELGLLMASVLLAMQGWHVHYLGPDLPVSEVTATVERTAAGSVLLSLVNGDADQHVQIMTLRQALPPEVTLLAGGRMAPPMTGGIARVQVLNLLDVDARFSVQ